MDGHPSHAYLYLDAARRLRASQIAGRARRLVPPWLTALGLYAPTATSWRPVARGLRGIAAQPQYGDVPPPHESGVFEAYDTGRRFPSPAFWTEEEDGLLYLFHLHGFEALAAYAVTSGTPQGDRFWRSVVESWLASEHRPRHPSWHPYPTSQRLIAWSIALSELDGWPADLRQRLAAEIHRQARYLRRSVEHDIGGNHVLKNATALCLAGAVVPESRALDRGLTLLRRQCALQFLRDGGHEELSTSYHRQAMADLEAVAQVLRQSNADVPMWLGDTILEGNRWQQALAGPDGRLPLFGDSWEGPPLDKHLGEPVTILRDSGYVVFRHGRDQLVIDAGQLCPPHLPPHAHADCLSFVLWADGRPVAVDPGSYTYSGSERDTFRGTSAHNTVEVAGQDQCVFWGPFRAGILPNVEGPTLRHVQEVTVIEASHDGYRRLQDPVVHHRAFLWWPGAGLAIVDRLACQHPHEVASRLCLAPGAISASPLRVGPMVVTALGGCEIGQEPRHYSQALGVRQQIVSLVIRRIARPGQPLGWALLREGVSALLTDANSIMMSDGRGGSVTVSLTPL